MKKLFLITLIILSLVLSSCGLKVNLGSSHKDVGPQQKPVVSSDAKPSSSAPQTGTDTTDGSDSQSPIVETPADDGETTYTPEPRKPADVKDRSYLADPWFSLGRTKIGMAKSKVTKMLGKPSVSKGNSITYFSSNKKNFVRMLFKGGKVSEIIFTSKSFKTIDGINTENYREDAYSSEFDKWKMAGKYYQIKYTLKSGGLTFYGINVDAPDGDSVYTKITIGVIHNGQNPEFDPIPNAAWETWDGSSLYN